GRGAPGALPGGVTPDRRPPSPPPPSRPRLVRELRQSAAARRLDGTSDADLLERFRADSDPDAFEAIVRRYGPCVLSACRKVLPSAADVEDAFQATFIVLLQKAPSIRRRQALGG